MRWNKSHCNYATSYLPPIHPFCLLAEVIYIYEISEMLMENMFSEKVGELMLQVGVQRGRN